MCLTAKPLLDLYETPPEMVIVGFSPVCAECRDVFMLDSSSEEETGIIANSDEVPTPHAATASEIKERSNVTLEVIRLPSIVKVHETGSEVLLDPHFA
jgi:hypothetical protein